jgi:hypothetical protein
VTLPSNEALNTVMRSLYAEPVVADRLQSALVKELNKTTSRILYILEHGIGSFTEMWKTMKHSPCVME